MYKIIVVACIMGICLGMADKTYPYYGLRVNLAPETYAKDLMTRVNQLFSTAGKVFEFEDIKDVTGDGMTKQGMTLSLIQTSDLRFTAGVSPILSWDGTYFHSNYTDASIAMDINFDWSFEFLGVHAMFGQGTATIGSSIIDIGTNFGVRIFDFIPCWIKPDWEVTILDLHGLYPFKGVEDWMLKLLNTGMTTDMNLMIGEKITYPLGTSIMRNYENAQSSMSKKTEVVLRNEFWRSAAQDNHLILSFKSNVTLLERAYNKAIWRYISTPVDTSKAIEICMNYEWIPDTMEVLGKSRQYYEVITTNITAIRPTVAVFSNIIPGLTDMYPAEMGVNMGCRESNSYDIVDLKCGGEGVVCHQMQIPFDCTFATNDTYGATFLTSTVFARGTYIPMISEKHGLKASLSDMFLHYYRHNPPLSTTGETSLNMVLEDIVDYMNQKEVLDDGLIIKPNRNNPFLSAKLNDHDACFYYSE